MMAQLEEFQKKKKVGDTALSMADLPLVQTPDSIRLVQLKATLQPNQQPNNLC